ncbi:MAG TPA: hypothetical protein VGY77_11270, partial [Gemmataceae bacterium]|nr:hypothetical protein [Gemmataceae bacterium]
DQAPAVAPILATRQSEPRPSGSVEPPNDSPSPNAYLTVRRQLEINPDSLLAHTFSQAAVPQNAVPPDPPILKVGRLGGLLDP